MYISATAIILGIIGAICGSIWGWNVVKKSGKKQEEKPEETEEIE